MNMDRHDDAALDWAIRVADPAFTDWEAFTLWLETDPRHAERYDAIVAALADAERDLADAPAPAALPAIDAAPPVRRHPARRWLGGAAAAALVGSVGLGVWTQRAQPYAVETAAGQPRTLHLADGSELVLAGASRVALDRAAPRMARVEKGDALFRIRHDAADPFRVEVGGVMLTDIGTVFDVGRHGDTSRVAVAEGAVMVDPDGAAIRLDPGQAARIERDRIVRQAVDPVDVGSWRDGRLAFDGTALAEVAARLSQHLGVTVTAAPAVARQRFRGTLDLTRLRDDPALLGALLGVRVRADADAGWTLDARG